ncbi:hypothetical protein IBT46_25670 [Erwinia sp. S38]|nr:hypothetical protein [Erwinia sp. S38]
MNSQGDDWLAMLLEKNSLKIKLSLMLKFYGADCITEWRKALHLSFLSMAGQGLFEVAQNQLIFILDLYCCI